jgi:hypothetical protein
VKEVAGKVRRQQIKIAGKIRTTIDDIKDTLRGNEPGNGIEKARLVAGLFHFSYAGRKS